MASKGLNGASIALGIISSIFFVVGCTGYSSNSEALQNVPWIKGTESDIDLDYYFGLRNLYSSYETQYGGVTIDANIKYGSSECGSSDACDKCEIDGQVAVAMTILALFFTVFTIGLSSALVAGPNKGMQIGNAIFSFLAAIFSLVAVAVFMGDCYNALKHPTSDDDFYYDDEGSFSLDLKWGAGSILTLVGMLLMWIVTVFQIAAAATSAASAPMAGNQA